MPYRTRSRCVYHPCGGVGHTPKMKGIFRLIHGKQKSCSCVFLVCLCSFLLVVHSSSCCQIKLVHAQFGKSNGGIEAHDLQLYEDLLAIYNQSSDVDTELGLGILCEKLELMSIVQFREESLAMAEMVAPCGWDVEQNRDKMSVLLKKFEDHVRAQNLNINIPLHDNCSSSNQAWVNQSPKSPVVPDDFRCPISLELMKDPVIICTGQVNGSII